MPSAPPFAPLPGERPSRRRVLATIGTVASISTAGCSDAITPGGSRDVGETIEVSVENATDEISEIAVRVENRDGEELFSRVFRLDPGHLVSRGAIETTPWTVSAFTSDGISRSWDYAPDLPVDFDCEREDIGITLRRDDTIEAWYDC